MSNRQTDQSTHFTTYNFTFITAIYETICAAIFSTFILSFKTTNCTAYIGAHHLLGDTMGHKIN
ncbi:MAG: hypothetical protein VX115_05545 [Candidatus Thermoplasmatota archaeon]|nr:hypothetical protein [Candidatus Thermoplasmatota archaeon]